MTDQKVQQRPWADIFRAASQKAHEEMPQTIRELVLKKCGEAAKLGKTECGVGKELEIKHLNQDDRDRILREACELLRKDGLEAGPAEWLNDGRISWRGIWVSWAKPQKSDKNSTEKE